MANEVIKEQQLTYSKLSELYDEMSDYLCDLMKDHEEATHKLTYLEDFIRFKKLDDEFAYFCEHAIKDPDEELPFPHLILKEN